MVASTAYDLHLEKTRQSCKRLKNYNFPKVDNFRTDSSCASELFRVRQRKEDPEGEPTGLNFLFQRDESRKHVLDHRLSSIRGICGHGSQSIGLCRGKQEAYVLSFINNDENVSVDGKMVFGLREHGVYRCPNLLFYVRGFAVLLIYKVQQQQTEEV